MELYQLRQFRMVARYENMTQAARELCVAQPALSKTIRNLEHELGAALFERTGKGLRRTAQGDILLRYAEEILSLAHQAEREIAESLSDGSRAPLLLCLHSSSELIGGALTSFARIKPDVRFEISRDVDNCDLLIDAVVAPEALPAGAVPLLTEEICLAVSPSHPLARQAAVPLSALAGEKFIVVSGSQSFARAMERLFSKADFKPDIAFECDSASLRNELVNLGLGVTLMAEASWAHGVEHDRLRLIHLEGAPCLRTIYYQRRGGYVPKNLPVLEAHLSEYFAGLRP